MKKVLLVVTLLCTMIGAKAQNYYFQIADIKTATPNILAVTLESEFILVDAWTRDVFYADIAPVLSGWQVNGSAVTVLGHQTSVWDEQRSEDGTHLPLQFRHTLYLQLPDNLINGQQYTIYSPDYGTLIFTFHDDFNFCESIKVNQVGYAERCTERYANFGIYMGDAGSMPLPGTTYFHVMDLENNTQVLRDTLQYWGCDTAFQASSSGEFAYRMDISSLQPGKYFIVVEGIGCSYEFGVGEEYTREILRTHVRGMYHQRCGIALEEPYTEYTRGACHQEVAFTQYYNGSTPGEGWITVAANEEMHHIVGGYHDAGDFDRRIYHTTIPLMMLNYYEAFADHFADDEYNIPESGNGIPDFLDEAMWGVLIWENLQLTSENSSDASQWGGVQSGTETYCHPTYGLERADHEGDGNRLYGTYAVSSRATLASCGFFAQSSRLLRELDPVHSAELMDRATAAWQFAQTLDTTERIDFRMYAALQMYLATATGDSVADMSNPYHLIFRQLADDIIVRGIYGWPNQYLVGNPSANIQTSLFASYMIYDGYRDETLVTGIMEKLRQGVERGGYMEWNINDYPYAQGATKFVRFGAATTQGRYTDPVAYLYRFSTDPAEKQRCYNIIAQMSDFSLGQNPLGKCFCTGLGSDPVQSPLHLDSYFHKYGVTPDGEPTAALGNVPGIVVYGISDVRPTGGNSTAVVDFMYPEYDQRPGLRKWSDGWSAVNLNEFTTHETMVWNTCMYAALLAPHTEGDGVAEYGTGMQSPAMLVYPNPVNDRIGVVGNFGEGNGEWRIYTLEGRVAMRGAACFAGGESEHFTLPQGFSLPQGAYILQVVSPKGVMNAKFIVAR